MVAQIPMIKIIYTLHRQSSVNPLIGGFTYSQLIESLAHYVKMITNEDVSLDELKDPVVFNDILRLSAIPYMVSEVVPNISYMITKNMDTINDIKMSAMTARNNIKDTLQAISGHGRMVKDEYEAAFRVLSIMIDYTIKPFFDHEDDPDFMYSMDDLNLMFYHYRFHYRFYVDDDGKCIYLRKVNWW